MANYSKYQQKIISNYYENFDNIKLSKLQEIVTELYLADSAVKADRLWKRAEQNMTALKFPPKIIKNIMSKREVVLLAKIINDACR